MSTIRFCDNIYVLEKGRFIESGTHQELIKNDNGLYYELYNKMNSYQNKDISQANTVYEKI
jgi:ABC-type multidrug transport system fused ATPase/permease subunit